MTGRENMAHKDINSTNDPLKKYRLDTVSKNISLEGLNWFHSASLKLCSDVDQDNRCLVCMKDP